MHLYLYNYYINIYYLYMLLLYIIIHCVKKYVNNLYKT